jgi:CHAD domain-containing protein
MSFKLDPTQHAGDEILRAAREQLGEAMECVGNRRTSVAERVHVARLHCKKARAALRLLRAQDRAGVREENRAMARAARKLSKLRDAEAMLACLEALLAHDGNGAARKKFAPLVLTLKAEQKRTMPKKTDVEDTLKRFVDRLGQSASRLAKWEPWDDVESMIADHRRAYRRARSGLMTVKKQETATAFHEWRKATKTYYYQCRLLRAAWPSAMKEVRDEVKSLARLLGDEHDLTVLRDALRKLRKKGLLEISGELFSATIDLVEDRREELRRKAIPLGERIFADRPRALAARMLEWWRVARDQPAA